MTQSLIEHLEGHLGAITSGFAFDTTGQKPPFQVVLFERSPVPGTRVLSTLGLSNRPLRVGDSERHLREEMIMMIRESDGPRNLPGILQQLAMEALAKDRAYYLGDVIGPRGELHTGATVSAFYFALPVYLPDSFQVCRTAHGWIVMGWLVPVTDSEAQFIRAHGAGAFEKLLEASDPELLDFRRPAIV